MVALLLVTQRWYPAGAALARYDFLTLAAIALQLFMLATGLETRREAVVILLFHLCGTAMEIFKVSAGSWIYPEPSALRIGGVPLFSGFMYASVGSYTARAKRVFDLRFTHHPPLWAMMLLGTACYINFFSHHFTTDIRAVLFAASAALLWRTRVYLRVWHTYRWMPLLVGLLLVTLFIWFAENIGTFARAWIYPSQVHGWSPVGAAKIGSWYLLMLISYTLVSLVDRPQPAEIGENRARSPRSEPTGPKTSRMR